MCLQYLPASMRMHAEAAERRRLLLRRQLHVQRLLMWTGLPLSQQRDVM